MTILRRLIPAAAGLALLCAGTAARAQFGSTGGGGGGATGGSAFGGSSGGSGGMIGGGS